MSDEMQDVIKDFLAESQEMLDALDQRFVALEADPASAELLNDIFRTMHNLKGMAGFLGFTGIVDITHRAETILNKLRRGEMKVLPEVINVILEAVDTIKLLITNVRQSGTDRHIQTEATAKKLDAILSESTAPAAGETSQGPKAAEPASAESAVPPLGEILVKDKAATKEQVLDALNEQQQQSDPKQPLGEILLQAKVVTERALEAALQKQGRPGGSANDDQTIRVETRRLDAVMNLVGELVLARNRLVKIGERLEHEYEADPAVRALGETLSQLNLITADLQLAVMKTRMLPVRKVLAKLPRMVRDLSHKLGKRVRLDLHGEETELDKSVADEISDPLVHLVRNAIDHGIETPEERRALGKPGEGVLRIAASQEGNSIVIRLSDDGRGIAPDRIKAKALAKGLVSEAELATMEPREIVNLIFLPGFSTAETVTDVSGRGVGMDVVRTNIRRLNGTVEIDSEPGKGSQVTIKLPLTIAIIQALMVEVERTAFAIPLSSVIEAVKISRADIKTVNGHEVLHLREHVLPLIRLAEEFEISANPDRDTCYIVVVGVGERRVGVIVDHLRAQEEVVIKSMWEYLDSVTGIAGATITGEGKVVLILDIAELVHHARARKAAA